MSSEILWTITSPDPEVRNRSLDSLCRGVSAQTLAEVCAELDRFRRASDNFCHHHPADDDGPARAGRHSQHHGNHRHIRRFLIARVWVAPRVSAASGVRSGVRCRGIVEGIKSLRIVNGEKQVRTVHRLPFFKVAVEVICLVA